MTVLACPSNLVQTAAWKVRWIEVHSFSMFQMLAWMPPEKYYVSLHVSVFHCFIVFTAQTPASRHTEWCGIWCAWCYWSKIWRWRHWKHICMHSFARGTSNRVPCADTGIPSRWIDGHNLAAAKLDTSYIVAATIVEQRICYCRHWLPPHALDRGPHPAALNQLGGSPTRRRTIQFAQFGATDTGFPARWIEGHNLAAAALGKPLLLEEFGNIATGDAANLTRVRDPLYRCD